MLKFILYISTRDIEDINFYNLIVIHYLFRQVAYKEFKDVITFSIWNIILLH